MSEASPSRVSSDLEPGLKLCDRYTVREKLADGAVASVYRALDARTETEVALKMLDPLRGADPVGRQRFEREFAVLCKLAHPSISRCMALGRDGDLDIFGVGVCGGGDAAGAHVPVGGCPCKRPP